MPILGNDIGNFSKKKLLMNMFLILNGYGDRAV